MYVMKARPKIGKMIICIDWKTTFTRGKQLSLSGNLVGKHDLLNAGGGGATCSRLKYQREQDEMRRERIISKVRPAPRIFALLKLPWGMRGLETKTYQMTQKNSFLKRGIMKVILRPKEHYWAFPINYDDLLCAGQNTPLSFMPLLEMCKVITYK